MPIILTEPIMIAGALVAVDGTTKTYNAAFEADQVAAGKAKWAPGSPAVGNQRVPLEVINSAKVIEFSDGGVAKKSGFRLDAPAGFSRWNFAKYPVVIYRSGNVAWSDFEPEAYVHAGCWSGPVYHVDPLSGNDGNTGLGAYLDDFSAAKKSLRGAILAGNAGGVPYRVRALFRKGVILNRTDSGGAVFAAPTAPALIEGVGGRPVIATWDALTWALHSGTCYKAARSNVGRTLDLLDTDQYGDFVPLKKVVDAAACVATQGSWAQVGSDVYVNRADGAPVTNGNTGCGLKVPGIQFDATAVSGCGVFDIHVVGGGNSCFDVREGVIGTDRNFVFVRCRGAKSSEGVNIFYFQNSPGLIGVVDCEASGAGADAYNQHWTVGGTSTMHVLRIGCRSRGNGVTPNQSNNSVTGHETTFEIDLNGDYGESFGAEAGYIGASHAWFIEPEVRDPKGDIVFGGGFTEMGFMATENAIIWIDGGSVASKSRALSARNESVIYHRGLRVLSGSLFTAENGRIAEY